VLPGVVQEPDDVVIVERVVRHPPGATRAHQSGGPQQPQLVRDRRFGLTYQMRQVADTALAMRERVNQAHARGIAQQPEYVGDGLHDSRMQQPGTNGRNGRLIGLVTGLTGGDVRGSSGWRNGSRHLTYEYMNKCSYVNSLGPARRAEPSLNPPDSRIDCGALVSPQELGLVVLTLGAAIVNGALGYGFSSITVPVALLFLTNRVLNPALVIIEVALNAYVLWVNRASIGAIRARVTPIMIGLLPGVIVGTFIVSRVNPVWLKFGTFLVLLPLILIQAAGFRRPIRREKSAGLIFGGGVGVLYSVTTISGPPLAVMLNNQGLAKQEFRAALGLVRLAESAMTAVAYAYVGLFTSESTGLIMLILPSILVGVPIGTVIIRHIPPETFRRVCMSFDAWVVGFGISTLMQQLKIVGGARAFLVLAAVVIIDTTMLYRFFSGRSRRHESSKSGSGVT
jgi:uncharacterized membrane protein YfcA